MRSRKWLLTPLAALLLGAASPIPLADQWKQPDLGPVEFGKIIVVGITEVRDTRHKFEEKFCSHMRSYKKECVVSYSVVPDLTRIGAADEIRATIEEQAIEAALAVRVVPLDTGSDDAWAEQWSAGLEASPRLRALVEEALPVAETKAKRFGVDVGLWRVEDGARIWAGRTDIVSRKRLNKGESGSFIQSVIYQLRRVDLI